MDDKRNLVENEQENNVRDTPKLEQQSDESPGDTDQGVATPCTDQGVATPCTDATDLPSYPPPAYVPQAQPVITYQPVAMGVGGIKYPLVGDSEIKAIRFKAVTSVGFSAGLSVFVCPILCSFPAIILGIVALCNLRKDTSSARSYANASLGLMIAAAIAHLFISLTN